MSDALIITISVIAGLVLGSIFFGGLWWTIRRGMVANNPALWFFSSLMLRVGTVFAGFYWVGKDDWKRLIACLAGFIIARLTVTWLTRQSCELKREESHAP